MLWMYAGFILLVLLLLALDLGVFHRHAHVISMKESLAWSAFWIGLGLLFSIFIYFGYQHHWMGLGLSPDMMTHPKTVEGVGLVYNTGGSAAIKYITGYLVEKSLAVDNIFVIAMIFAYFRVPAMYQHRVLFWGIVGALLMRGAMIAIGVELIRRFDWIIYIFGGFLIITGLRMLIMGESEEPTGQSRIERLAQRLIPITSRYHGEHFFVRGGSTASREPAVPNGPVELDSVAESRPGALLATPLFLALVMIEFTDLIFAVDSIPAIFAITTDAFIVFTSNVFAILGLRSLYFALAGIINWFHYLKVALAFVLVLVGTKMLAHVWLKQVLGQHFNLYLLAAVLGILLAGVVMSLVKPVKPKEEGGTPQPDVPLPPDAAQ